MATNLIGNQPSMYKSFIMHKRVRKYRCTLCSLSHNPMGRLSNFTCSPRHGGAVPNFQIPNCYYYPYFYNQKNRITLEPGFEPKNSWLAVIMSTARLLRRFGIPCWLDVGIWSILSFSSAAVLLPYFPLTNPPVLNGDGHHRHSKHSVFLILHYFMINIHINITSNSCK